LNPIKGFYFFSKQETLPLLLSTGWFQEQVEHVFTFDQE